MGCEASLASSKSPKGDTNAPTNDVSFRQLQTNQAIAYLKERTIDNLEKAFIKESLDAHNEYRKDHGAPPLEHCIMLTAHAQTWAEELAKRDMLMHSNRTLPDGSTVGETIYSCWSPGSLDIKAQTVMRNWYNEQENYDYGRAEFSVKSGRFTQMVWKDTKEMGIARARSGEGNVYIVANYRPTGNAQGSFESNVVPVEGRKYIDALSKSSSSMDSFDYDKKYAELLTYRANRTTNVIKLDEVTSESDEVVQTTQ